MFTVGQFDSLVESMELQALERELLMQVLVLLIELINKY